MTNTLRLAKEQAGYLPKNSKETLGSVALLDTAISCIGITLLENHLKKIKDLPTSISFSQKTHEGKKLKFKSKTNCEFCGTK